VKPKKNKKKRVPVIFIIAKLLRNIAIGGKEALTFMG
jgi:hypothetical protein